MIKKSVLALILLLNLTACSNKEVKKVEPASKESLGIEDKKKSSKDDTSASELQKYETSIYDYFDTITSFTAYCKNEDEYNKYKELVESEMAKYHKLFNNYDSYKDINNITTINEKAGKEKVKVDQSIIDLIKEGKKWYKETDGDINIAYGRVLQIWSDYREEGLNNKDKARLPKDEELDEASKHKNIDAIEIDENEKTVYISDPDVQIDIGGIGKGYATELIKRDLIKNGLKSGLLSVGGDVAIIGNNPKKGVDNFKIAIKDPSLSEKNPYAAIVSVKDTSVVTSGDYERFYEVDGKRYHHIIDPKTNYPSTNFKSVSVILDDIGQADALSTALFIKDLDEGKKLLEKFKAEAMWIDKDNKVYKSAGWDKFDVSDEN
ncbi:FAD:protein FMN transferase [Anaerococcus porci]|uniref:FAD:protein FMN transferase n=1 Tax=Anaerococcus porci TaxID=2652269 RepID=UPI002A75AC3C|nr:FAD:protein FMN transferase [Anaerococcus porci]MDY3006148.1 FAD:protein FMN transferase [Anaerococcus porci]